MKRTLLFTVALLLLLVLPGAAQVSAPDQASARRDQSAQARLERAHAEMDEARANYEVAVKTLEKLQQEIRGLTHRLDVSSEALQKAAARLDEQLETLELDEVGSGARRKATEQAIKQETDRLERGTKDDRVAVELQNLVTAREAQLARINQLMKTGAVAQAEMEAAVASVAEAKAKLAERQQSSVGGIDGESLASLRRDLLNLSISEQERHARMEYLKMQQDRLSQAMDNLTNIQERRYEVERARAQLQRAQELLEIQKANSAQGSSGETEKK